MIYIIIILTTIIGLCILDRIIEKITPRIKIKQKDIDKLTKYDK